MIIILVTMSMQNLGAGLPGCGELLDSGDVYYSGFNNVTALELYRRAFYLVEYRTERLKSPS